MQTYTDFITLIIQMILAVVGVWYTMETRRLRIQNDDQVKMIRNQNRNSIAPYLVPSIMDVGLKKIEKKIQDDKEITDEDRKEKLENVRNSSIKFVASVLNCTSKIPSNVVAFVFDNRTQSFLISDSSAEVISEKDSVTMYVSEPYISQDGIRKQVGEHFGEAAEIFYPHFSLDKKSYIICVFRDIEGHLYLIKRPFSVDSDGDASHSASKFFSGKSVAYPQV